MLRTQPTEKLLEEISACIELIVSDQKEISRSRKIREFKELATSLPIKPVAVMSAGTSVAVLSALSRTPSIFSIAAGVSALLYGAIKLEDQFSELEAKKKKKPAGCNLSPKIRKQVYDFLATHKINYKNCSVTLMLEDLYAYQAQVKKFLDEKNKLNCKELANVQVIASHSPAVGITALVKHVSPQDIPRKIVSYPISSATFEFFRLHNQIDVKRDNSAEVSKSKEINQFKSFSC